MSSRCMAGPSFRRNGHGLWLYHKPSGLITATRDPEERATIFDHLPKHMPRVVTVGRLDLTTEGLLLLTNDGELARAMELPSTGLERHYRARAHGHVTPDAITQLRRGVVVDDVEYASIIAVHERQTGTNNWLGITLKEGKNREVRKALDAVGLTGEPSDTDPLWSVRAGRTEIRHSGRSPDCANSCTSG